MILADIQENVIRCKEIIKKFEGDKVYRFLKSVRSSVGQYEKEIRDLEELSKQLSNQLHIDILSIADIASNKGLIKSIEIGYFNQIMKAVSQKSLISITPNLNFNIPNTAFQMMEQDKFITDIRNNMNQKIIIYSKEVKDFRHNYNVANFNIGYYLPKMDELPQVLGTITLSNIFPSQNPPLTPPPTPPLTLPIPVPPSPPLPPGALGQQPNQKKTKTNPSQNNDTNDIINKF